MWLLRFLPMWEYICPKCRKTVKANSHHCPHCGERFPQAIRIPPTMLKDVKKLEYYVRRDVMPRISKFQRNCLARCFVKSDDTPSHKQVNLKKTKFLNDLHLKGRKVYICPKCKKQVPHKSHKCMFCGEKYLFAVRVPLKLLKDVRNGIATKELHDYVHIYLFPQFNGSEQQYLNQYFTIIRVQGNAKGETYSAGTLGVTMGSAPASGDVLVATILVRGGQTVSSISETNVAWSYVISKMATSGSADCDTEIWFGVVSGTGGTGVTITFSATMTNAIADICEYSGVATSSYTDKTATNQGGSTGPIDTGTTTTTTQASELWIGALGETHESDTMSSPTNGFTLLDGAYYGDPNGHSACLGYAEKIVSSTGTADCSVTSSGSLTTWSGCIATFLAASGATNVNLSDSGSGSDSVSVQAAISEVDTCSGVENLAAVPIFQDNFAAEGAAGSLSSSLWNVSIKDVALTQTPVYNGNSWSARASADGNQSWLITRFSQTYKTLYARAYFYYEEYPVYNTNAWWDLFIEYYDTGSSTLTFIADFGLAQNASGQYVWDLVYNNNGWGHEEQSAQQTNPSLNTWYCLELMGTADSSVGEIRCWVNGSELTDMHLTGLNTTATTINQFALFDTYYTTDTTNCVVSTSYNGPIGYAQNLVQASIPVSDLGTGADSLSVSGGSPAVNVSDSSLGSDAISALQAQIPVSDSGSGSDALASINARVPVADAGLGADTLSSIIAQILAADSGLGTDSLVLGSPVNLSDSGSGSDALVIQAQIVLTDVGAGLDSAIVKVSTTISDVGLGSDVLTVSVPISLSDAGLGTDTVNVVIVGALPTHAIIIQAEKGAIKLQTEKGTVTLQSDSD